MPKDATPIRGWILLVLALVLVVIGPRIQKWARRRAEESGQSPEHVSPRRMAALVFGTFAIGIYGGYFTAAQGIMLVAAMSALLPEDMQRMNATKNLLSLLVNIVAAVAYTVVAFDRISWEAAGLIAVASTFCFSRTGRFCVTVCPKLEPNTPMS